MDILKIKDPNTGKWVTIPALKTPVDKNFDPKSPNAQSGLAVDEAFNWYMITKINPAIGSSVSDYGENIITPQIDNLKAKDKELEVKDAQLEERIDKIISSGLIRKVVEALPDKSEAAENVVYMVKNNSDSNDNIYDEYMLTIDKSILGVLEAATVDNNWYTSPALFPAIYEGETCTAFVDISGNGTLYGLTFNDNAEGLSFGSSDSNLISLIGQYGTDRTVLYDITANSLTSIDVVQYTATKRFELIGSTAVDLSGYAKKDDVDKAVEEGKAYANNNLANALKGSKSGQVISIDDASPVEHELVCKLERKNLCCISSDGIAGYRMNFNYDGDKITFSTTDITTNSRIQFLLPIELFALGETYIFKADSTVKPSNIYVGNANNHSDTDSIRIFGTASSLDVEVPQVKFTVTNLDKPYICIYMYFTGQFSSTDEIATMENMQIELGSTATKYAPYIQDFSDVKIKVLEDNLLTPPYDYENGYVGEGVTYTYNENGVITINGTSTKTSFFVIKSKLQLITGQKYYCYICPKGGSQGGTWRSYVYSESQQTIIANDYGDGNSFIADENDFYSFTFRLDSGHTFNNVTFTPILTTKEPVIYTPNADGTVDGITSLSPNMTLLTDTDGAIINLDYNRDINKAFAELQQAILNNA